MMREMYQARQKNPLKHKNKVLKIEMTSIDINRFFFETKVFLRNA
jgi:hypothetical protein